MTNKKTLRDEFAIAALAGMLADSNVTARPRDLAAASYSIADAMLEARRVALPEAKEAK